MTTVRRRRKDYEDLFLEALQKADQEGMTLQQLREQVYTPSQLAATLNANVIVSRIMARMHKAGKVDRCFGGYQNKQYTYFYKQH